MMRMVGVLEHTVLVGDGTPREISTTSAFGGIKQGYRPYSVNTVSNRGLSRS